MMRLVFAESAGSSDAFSSVKIEVIDLEPEFPIAMIERPVVPFAVGVIFFVEVRKRGDLLKCGRFDHIRQRSDACRKQDLAAAKRRSKLLVQAAIAKISRLPVLEANTISRVSGHLPGLHPLHL
jgi:hypothetical protein